MSLSFEDAVSSATAPGGRFELAPASLPGADGISRDQFVFVNAPKSLRALFDSLRTREGVFLVYEDDRRTFAEVMVEVDALAYALVHRYGLSPGDRVGIAMRNFPEWIVSFAAITSVGGVAVCLNGWWTPDELAYGLHDSGCSVVFADVERVARIAPLLNQNADPENADPEKSRRAPLHVVAVRDDGEALPDGVDRWDDVVVRGAAMPDVPIDPHADATILYTSGTTGDPKGAVSSHHAVLSALLSFGCRSVVQGILKTAAALPDGQLTQPAVPANPTSFILTVPLFHVTGLVPVMLGAVLGGSKLVMMRKWNPERALELIEREQVTTFVGVPTMSWDLLESPDFARRDTSSLVSVGGGGAPAPPELVKRIDSSFSKGRPSIGYGMTETNGYGPQNLADDYVRKPTSAGRTIPTMQVRVVADDGEVVPSGEVGEIEFRGPNLIRGYWNKPDATAATFHDGWLRTGDLGRLDDEGFVYVVDRAKDMVLRAGENVYCAEIEAVLYEHPAVYEVAVFGLPHERLGEEVAVAVVLRVDHAAVGVDAAALQVHVQGRLAAFKVPTQVFFHTEQLPRGATGKILKRELRDRVLSGVSVSQTPQN